MRTYKIGIGIVIVFVCITTSRGGACDKKQERIQQLQAAKKLLLRRLAAIDAELRKLQGEDSNERRWMEKVVRLVHAEFHSKRWQLKYHTIGKPTLDVKRKKVSWPVTCKAPNKFDAGAEWQLKFGIAGLGSKLYGVGFYDKGGRPITKVQFGKKCWKVIRWNGKDFIDLDLSTINLAKAATAWVAKVE